MSGSAEKVMKLNDLIERLRCEVATEEEANALAGDLEDFRDSLASPPEQTTEYAVIGEADLDTIPIRRVGWEAPSRFDTLEAARDYLAEVRRTDREAINPRIQQRTVGSWEDTDD